MTRPKKRRSRGSGGVISLPSGYYAYQYTDSQGNRKTKSLRTKNRKLAEERATEFIKVIHAVDKKEVMVHIARQRELIYSKDLSLDEVWNAFLGTKPTAGDGTLKLYQSAFNQFRTWVSDNRKDITSFTTIDIETARKYMAWIWESGVSASTYNDKRNALALITKSLASRYNIDENPWTKTDRKKGSQQKRLPLTSEQVADVLKYFENPPESLYYPMEMKCLFHLCLYAGMRLSDAVSLKWECVDLLANTISYVPAKTMRTSGVTATLPILPPLRECIDRANRETDYVLPRVRGHFTRNPDYIKEKLKGIIQETTGEGEQEVPSQALVSRSLYGIHSLRHTFASEAAKAGVSPAYLSMMTGDTMQTLQRFYVKVGYQQKTMDGFSGISVLLDGKHDRKLESERLKLIKLAETLPLKMVKRMLKKVER